MFLLLVLLLLFFVVIFFYLRYSYCVTLLLLLLLLYAVHHYGRAVIMFGIPYVYTQSRILKVGPLVLKNIASFLCAWGESVPVDGLDQENLYEITFIYLSFLFVHFLKFRFVVCFIYLLICLFTHLLCNTGYNAMRKNKYF